MSNYTKAVDFAAKDALLAGNPAKLGKGTEVDTEFNNIAVAIATKVDSGGALGTPSSGVLTNCTGLPTAGLANDAVTYAKMQNVSATDKLLGRSTAGAGDVEEITCTAAGRALLDDVDAAAMRATIGAAALAGSALQTFSVATATAAGHAVTKAQLDAVPIVTFASAAENIAGSIENKAVDPLGIREAFNATGSAPVYACRAWVNFNGVGTIAIRASGNVSSITDNGVGNYTVNFATALPNADYSASVFVNNVSGGAYLVVPYLAGNGIGHLQFITPQVNGGVSADTAYNLVTIHV